MVEVIKNLLLYMARDFFCYFLIVKAFSVKTLTSKISLSAEFSLRALANISASGNASEVVITPRLSAFEYWLKACW